MLTKAFNKPTILLSKGLPKDDCCQNHFEIWQLFFSKIFLGREFETKGIYMKSLTSLVFKPM